jgi:hypothetical protein
VGIQGPICGYSVLMAMKGSKTLARLMEKKKGKGKGGNITDGASGSIASPYLPLVSRQ